MLEFVLELLLFQAAIFGLFSAFIATQKNRDAIGWFLIGFFFSILAIFALIAIPPRNPNAPKQTYFQGENDLNSQKYQMFLVKKYSVEKNATLEKYSFDDEVFDNLEDALKSADGKYRRALQLKIDREIEALELQKDINSFNRAAIKKIFGFFVIFGVSFLAFHCSGL